MLHAFGSKPYPLHFAASNQILCLQFWNWFKVSTLASMAEWEIVLNPTNVRVVGREHGEARWKKRLGLLVPAGWSPEIQLAPWSLLSMHQFAPHLFFSFFSTTLSLDIEQATTLRKWPTSSATWKTKATPLPKRKSSTKVDTLLWFSTRLLASLRRCNLAASKWSKGDQCFPQRDHDRIWLLPCFFQATNKTN